MTVSRLTLARRKLYLQYLQVKKLKNCDNLVRKNEQQKVMRMLLLNPRLLLSGEMMDRNENWLYKYINNLNMNAKNDRLFESAKLMLKNG